jgi:GNAT superfamily N-acetyltransferase
MDKLELKKCDASHIDKSFLDIYLQLPKYFRDDEDRLKRDMKKNPNYNFYGVKKNGESVAILCYLPFPNVDATFVDVFVVTERLRGNGVGPMVMRHFIDTMVSTSNVVLEAEPEKVPFYERLGFKRSGFDYYQPPFGQNTESIKLEFLYQNKPGELSREEFEKIRDEIYHKNYYLEDIRGFLTSLGS